MANSVDPDKTAPICSGSTLFAIDTQFVSNARQLFAADDFSRRHFQMHVFLCHLRIKLMICLIMFEKLIHLYISARQCSKRGGNLHVNIKGDRVELSGSATLVIKGQLFI